MSYKALESLGPGNLRLTCSYIKLPSCENLHWKSSCGYFHLQRGSGCLLAFSVGWLWHSFSTQIFSMTPKPRHLVVFQHTLLADWFCHRFSVDHCEHLPSLMVLLHLKVMLEFTKNTWSAGWAPVLQINDISSIGMSWALAGCTVRASDISWNTFPHWQHYSRPDICLEAA